MLIILCIISIALSLIAIWSALWSIAFTLRMRIRSPHLTKEQNDEIDSVWNKGIIRFFRAYHKLYIKFGLSEWYLKYILKSQSEK